MPTAGLPRPVRKPNLSPNAHIDSALNPQPVKRAAGVAGVLHHHRRPSVQVDGLLDADGETAGWSGDRALVGQRKSILLDEIGDELGVRRQFATVEE